MPETNNIIQNCQQEAQNKAIISLSIATYLMTLVSHQGQWDVQWHLLFTEYLTAFRSEVNQSAQICKWSHTSE